MLEGLKKLIEGGKPDEEIQDYIKGRLFTPDGVKEYLGTEDGKKLVQPIIDSHFSKGLETWKANNLDKAIEEEIAKRYPPETDEAKQLRELTKKLEQIEREKNIEALKNKAIAAATEKNLPIKLVDFLVTDTEEGTNANLALLEKEWQKELKKAVEAEFKGSGREPYKGESSTGYFTREQLDAMTPEEINKNWEAISKQMAEGKL